MIFKIKPLDCCVLILSSTFLAFGLYHVHSLSGVTEGGVLGLNLLLEHWLRISPAITNFVASALCYMLGWHLLGGSFILRSAIAAGSFSAAYAVFARFEPIWPQLYHMPLLASILGAVFVGVGTGICIRFGGAVCGDDALAMCISHVTRLRVEQAYLISDLTVLGLSLSYIPLNRIGYSLLTVVLSGQIIGRIQRIPPPQRRLTAKRSATSC